MGKTRYVLKRRQQGGKHASAGRNGVDLMKGLTI